MGTRKQITSNERNNEMKSPEFYEGFHSFKARLTLESCPYRFNPSAAKEWKRGFAKAQAEAK